MTIDFTNKEFRRLLDLVYIGNWILNSIRGDDRFEDYDALQSKIFAECIKNNMPALYENKKGTITPSSAFVDGGIHDAIEEYEDTVFFEILAEELAKRDMGIQDDSRDNYNDSELNRRINDYMNEFYQNGIDNISLDK